MARRDPHHPLFPPPLEWRDCAALAGVLASLCQLMLYVLHDPDEVLATARRIRGAARRLVRAQARNARTALKLEMLATPAWRAQVLRELGGARALSRWRRIMARRFAGDRRGCPPLCPHPSPAQRAARRANLAKAKAARASGFRPAGGPHKLIYKDCVKVDGNGQFRLAPMPRISRSIVRQGGVKRGALSLPSSEPRSIYRIKTTRLNPIPLWPVEFDAALGSCSRPPKSSVALGADWSFGNEAMRAKAGRAAPPFCDSG